jgi:bifunctional non-homologous end joining protein LigD
MLPTWIAPQLLTAGKAAPQGDGWLHEVKYDGYRLLCRLEHGRARLFTRPGNDWTSQLPGVAAAMESLGVSSGWFDGEMVALRADGTPDFHALPRAIRGGRGALPLVYQVFDVLHANGRDTLGLDLLARKRVLEDLVRDRCGGVRYADHLVGNGPAFHQAAHAAGLEGIVSKRLGSRYRPGARSRDWVKIKCMHRYVFRVAGLGRDGALLVDEDGSFVGCAFYQRRPQVGRTVEVAALQWTPGRKLRHATLVSAPAERRAEGDAP